MLETGSDSFYLVECYREGIWRDASYDGFAEYLPVSCKPTYYYNRLRYDDLQLAKEATHILKRKCVDFLFRIVRVNLIVLRTQVI